MEWLAEASEEIDSKEGLSEDPRAIISTLLGVQLLVCRILCVLCFLLILRMLLEAQFLPDLHGPALHPSQRALAVAPFGFNG